MTLNKHCVGILLALVTAAYGASINADWCTCGSTSDWTNDWGTGADVTLSIPVTNAVSGGWEMRIRFDQSISKFQIWNAEYVSGDPGNIIVTKNQWYNSDLPADSNLKMNFIFEYNTKPTIEYQLEYQPMCDCGGGGGNPTQPPGPTNPPGTNPPPSPGPYNYGEVLKKSILFYEAQRSGDLPDSNRVDFRGDSALGDGDDVGLDLTGGWYDAGDHVKFGFPMAQTATTLIYGLLEFHQAYSNAGQLDIMFKSVRWVLEYFIKCHPTPDEFYFQVGDGEDDHAFWGRPEQMTMARPSWKLTTSKPGSDCAGETAAAMAAGSIVFKDEDPDFSADLLKHAKELYAFANNYQATYSESFPEVVPFYGSTGYGDELAWAAAWLYPATKDKSYLTEAENHYDLFGLGGEPWAFSWDDKKAGVQILLYRLTGNDAKYGTAVRKFLDGWLPDGGIKYTPKGLAWRDQWGPNRYAGNSAFIACLADAAGLKNSNNPNAYPDFAKNQINYMLGDGIGRSFVVGFGKDPANAPHHRSSSCKDLPETCDWDDFRSGGPNPQILQGALVGGPDANDDFWDDRTDYIMNEVACDYNSGFQSAVAGVSLLYS